MEESNKYKKKMWKEYLENTNLPQEVKKAAMDIGLLFMDNVKFLYAIRKCVMNGGGAMEDEKTKVQYETVDEYHILRHGNIELALRQKEMDTILVDMIDVFEDILPLGSVVDLKKEFLAQQMDLSNIKNFRVVISKRFIGGEMGCYYPYAAVVYPIGMAGANRTICFSTALIDKVIHTGYSDSVEEAFVYQMKNEMIVKEHRKSMGFANEEERKAMEKLLLNNGE